MARGSGGRSSIGVFFDKVSNFNLLSLFRRKEDPPTPRTVFYNEPLPEDYYGPKGRPLKNLIYPSNQIITAKYNIVTFLPKNLLEQFRRVANVFFLVIVILQFFPQFTNINPGLSALPLIAVLAATAVKDGFEDIRRHRSDRVVNKRKVLALGGGGWINTNWTHNKSRDFLGRLRLPDGPKTRKAKKLARGLDHDTADRTENGRHVAAETPASRPKLKPKYSHRFRHNEQNDSVEDIDQEKEEQREEHAKEDWHLRYTHLAQIEADDVSWRRRMWEDLRVGDFVKLRCDDYVPADIIVLSTSGDEDTCYVETKNLDGETNLKSRQAVSHANHIRTARDCAAAEFKIESEAPDVDMFSWNAALTFPADGPNKQLDNHGTPLRVPVSLATTLLRGCVLRNTDWVIGAVVMTGADTKIALNSGRTPSKRTRIERQMNPQVLLNLLILALMSIMCAIVDHYLEVTDNAEGSYWTFLDNRSDDNPMINGLITFANALITFQNIVPISLYITIEFVKLLQAFFIYADDAMVYDKSGQRAIARTWNLGDDLGQIEYIFSDKTGTLTQNVMQFRRCAINGSVYAGDDTIETESSNEKTQDQATRQMNQSMTVKSATDSDETKANESETGSDGRDGKSVNSAAPPKSPGGQSSMSTASQSSDSGRSSEAPTRKGTDSAKGSIKTSKPEEVASHFSDRQLTKDLQDTGSTHGRTLHAFWATLALCHTVVASTDENGKIKYIAQSPDEAALVQAAADVGFVFAGRDLHILKVRTPHSSSNDEYELLNVLEFTSSRKRMSVIVRRRGGDADGRIYLLTKGADNVIFERLAAGQDQVKRDTQQNLEDFANEGLRTLCLAYRELSDEEYSPWSRQYDEAFSSVDQREKRIESSCALIEHDLLLLGASAIEDKLQDGVPDAIRDLKRAGIKIWVLTGDKLETAISIGFSSNLLSKDMTLILIRGGQFGEKNSAYEQMKNALERFFAEEHVPTQNVRESSAPNNDFELTRTVTGMSLVRKAQDGQDHGRYALVIDGSAMTHAFSEPETEALFLSLATKCQAVIGCRSSPLQKALVVSMVKEGTGAMTLAIGDGANDVSMIQAAHVGIGVSGEEGLQAVNASDYAIAQFRFLKRLILVHGHWSYMRISNLIPNFFYKNIIGVSILFYFQFYCAYSTTTVYEFTYLLFWNSFWTLTAVIGAGLFERDVVDRALMQVPEIYSLGREQRAFGLLIFIIYMVDGIYQGAICFFFILYTYQSTTGRTDGYDVGLYEFSTVMAIAAVTQANLYNGLTIRSWSWWIVFAVFLGIFLIWVYTAVYSALSPLSVYSQVYGNDHYLFHSGLFWFSLPLAIVLSMAPRWLHRFWISTYSPDDIDIIREVTVIDKNHDFINDPNMPGLRTAAEYAENDLIAKGGKRLQGQELSRNGDPELDGIKRPGALPLRRPYTHQSHGSQVDMSTGGEEYAYRGSFLGMEEGEGGRYLRRIQTEKSLREDGRTSQNDSNQGSEAVPKSRRNTLMRSIRPRSSSGLFPAMRKTLKRQHAESPMS